MYDVIIIGAGSAGLSAASIFRNKGLKYLIVHHGFKGTTCASSGCMPSKALIQIAKSIHERKKFDDFGIRGGDALSVDIPSALNHVRELRDRFVSGIIDGMDKYEIVYGKPRFTAADTIEVEGKDYKAKNFIISTGSSPRIPKMFKRFEDDILTTDNLFDQLDLPKRIAVIGLGNIGVEMGQALGRMGVKIIGINRGSNVAGLQDADISKIAKGILSKDMDIILNADVQSIERDKRGYQITLKDKTVECDKILMAAGRTPNLDGLNLKEIGVNFTDKGAPETAEDGLKIAGYSIYLSGDVNGIKPLLHEAQDESEIIAAKIIGEDKPACRRVPLEVTFTDPSIARIGQQPEEIDEEVITGEVSFENQGRARVMGENHGILKVFASKNNKTILGACLMAPAGEHLAHLLALAVQEKLTLDQFLNLPFYHPTLEEGLRTALRDIHDQNHDCVTDRLC